MQCIYVHARWLIMMHKTCSYSYVCVNQLALYMYIMCNCFCIRMYVAIKEDAEQFWLDLFIDS